MKHEEVTLQDRDHLTVYECTNSKPNIEVSDDIYHGTHLVRKEFDHFTIEYTDDDLPYIDDLIQQFLVYQKKIMDFFNLKALDKKVQIKIWNNMEEYEKYIKSETKRIFHVSIEIEKWETGRAITTKEESQIHFLSYKERLKRERHSNDTLDSIIKVMIHEFAHTCHAQYKQYETTLIWINEALATVLADQYSNQTLVLDCTLEQLLNENINYINYYTLGKYLFENYKKDNILKLSRNNELLKQMTPTILDEAKEWLSKYMDRSFSKLN